jgi:hypothetical protein
MNNHDKRIIHSSEEAGWRTPPALFVALAREFDVVVDAAASLADRLCDAFFGPDHPDPLYCDALKVPDWHAAADGGAVFLNPPYSRKLLRETGDNAYDIASWATVCAVQARKGATIVGVFPYSVQTAWWYTYVRHGDLKAHEIRTIPHRVSFLRPDGSPAGNAGGNTAIVIWRPPCGYVGDWQPAERVWDYL